MTYSLSNDAAGLFEIDSNHGEVTVSSIPTFLHSSSWLNGVSYNDEFSSAFLIYERISDGGISETSLHTDAFGSTIGEYVDWYTSRDEWLA